MAVRVPSRVRKLGRRARLAVEYERAARARRAPIRENVVLYESFAGNGMLCNPEAIFRELLAADDMGHLEHVWALADPAAFPETVAEFAGHPRVRFVTYKSSAYDSALATAKYLVNNATFPPQFGKREGQIYLNTWHGTPLKAMGYDIEDGAVETRNVVRNFLSVDYLLAPNDGTAEMYLTAYRMRNIYRGAIVHDGSPRVDRQFAGAEEQAKTRARLRSAGVVVDDDQKIILYAPTWKGSFYAPTNDIRQLRARVEAVASQIDRTEYRLLLKVHQQVYKHAIIEKDLRDILVPNDVPTNDVLAVTDVLVTDYSSIFIDFLATGRPILFYAPDIAQYESSRGLYLPLEQWPGPISRELDELVGQIKRLNTGDDGDAAVAYAGQYAAARERYCAREDGQASRRIIDIVFRGHAAGHDVRRGFTDGRVPMLIHLGGMLPNGITASGLCLLDNIDHERYDVTATFAHTNREDRKHLIGLINKNVRVLPRFGGINGGKLQVASLLRVKKRTAEQQERTLTTHADLLRDEWTRCFGAARFDHVIDFSGYAPFWAKLLSMRGPGTFSIWMHNDIRAEADSPGRGEWLRASLEGMCGLYQHADSLVSVSDALRDVNARRLADRAPAEKFTFARNTINFERVRHLAYGVTGGRTLPTGLVEQLDPRNLTESIGTLIAAVGAEQVEDEVERRLTLARLLPPVPQVRTFVTAGRLSAEKNQERLIRAFDLVHQDDPDTRLVVLGTGPLLERLTEVVDELGLAASVTLAGHEQNPYVVVANSDCFVLSSDYEGQPMVLLEALILERPIVTTEFGSVRGALPDGYGLIVPRTVEDLAQGLQAFLRGEVASRPFDCVAYNAAATNEVYRAIGAA
jgi:CDP-glycerol glycerophosphotransferase